MTPCTRQLSVVMPMRNAASFVEASIESILHQTFTDFELVVLDDASDDASAEIVERLAIRDGRIRLVRAERPLGVVCAANEVVALARAPLIARMDADDTSHPERLARQIAILRGDAAVGAVATLYDGIDRHGSHVRSRDRWRLLRTNAAPPFPHGSVMFRRVLFDRAGGYRTSCAGWEDQDLFLRIAGASRFVVLPEPLYNYRYHSESTTTAWNMATREKIVATRHACIAAYGRSGEYESVLGGPGTAPVTRRVAAAAVRYEAGMRLWSGEGRSSFHALVRRSRSATSLACTVWASLHPRSLRAVLRAAISLRDFAAGAVIRDGKVYPWRFA